MTAEYNWACVMPLSSTMNTTNVGMATDLSWVVEQILAKIMTGSYRRGGPRESIPIKGFTQAPARLKRRGISHLVTLEDYWTGKEVVVPLGVEDDKYLVRTQFCRTMNPDSHRGLASWRGREVHRISGECTRNMDLLPMRIWQCLKAEWNRFRHKLEKSLHRLNVRIGKYRPFRSRKDRSFRYESARMCH